MTDYLDYTKILLTTNFVGGAGQSDLSTVTSSTDIRAEVTKEGTDYYQFYYKILESEQDFNNLGYYSPKKGGCERKLGGTNTNEAFLRHHCL